MDSQKLTYLLVGIVVGMYVVPRVRGALGV